MRRIPLAGPQQVGHRGEAAALDEVADSVAAIEEPALLAIDVAELGLGGDHPLEAG
jgi:hypothetical protein